MKRRVSNHIESWASKIPFRISNFEWDHYPTVVCEIEQDGVVGQGEALGVYYHDETEKTMLEQLEAITPELAGRCRAARNCSSCCHQAAPVMPPMPHCGTSRHS